MEVAVVADEVLGTDGGICIHRVRFEVLDCKGHVMTVRIDYSAAESAARVPLVVHSETVPARSDGPGSARPRPDHSTGTVRTFATSLARPQPRNHAVSAWPLDPETPRVGLKAACKQAVFLRPGAAPRGHRLRAPVTFGETRRPFGLALTEREGAPMIAAVLIEQEPGAPVYRAGAARCVAALCVVISALVLLPAAASAPNTKFVL